MVFGVSRLVDFGILHAADKSLHIAEKNGLNGSVYSLKKLRTRLEAWKRNGEKQNMAVWALDDLAGARNAVKADVRGNMQFLRTLEWDLRRMNTSQPVELIDCLHGNSATTEMDFGDTKTDADNFIALVCIGKKNELERATVKESTLNAAKKDLKYKGINWIGKYLTVAGWGFFILSLHILKSIGGQIMAGCSMAVCIAGFLTLVITGFRKPKTDAHMRDLAENAVPIEKMEKMIIDAKEKIDAILNDIEHALG